jgi:hypothetical protein
MGRYREPMAFIRQLLQRDCARRLACSSGGVADLKQHPFMRR